MSAGHSGIGMGGHGGKKLAHSEMPVAKTIDISHRMVQALSWKVNIYALLLRANPFVAIETYAHGTSFSESVKMQW